MATFVFSRVTKLLTGCVDGNYSLRSEATSQAVGIGLGEIAEFLCTLLEQSMLLLPAASQATVITRTLNHRPACVGGICDMLLQVLKFDVFRDGTVGGKKMAPAPKPSSPVPFSQLRKFALHFVGEPAFHQPD